MKSIHFATPPTMNGKLTMRYTDVTVENLKPKMLAAIHRDEMLGRDVGDVDLDCGEGLAPWDCHWCDFREATGVFRPHSHEYD